MDVIVQHAGKARIKVSTVKGAARLRCVSGSGLTPAMGGRRDIADIGDEAVLADGGNEIVRLEEKLRTMPRRFRRADVVDSALRTTATARDAPCPQ